MPHLSEIHLSQSSLQDYLDCPRRFELRYLKKVEWPALISEPVLEHERHMMLGDRFHHIIHQYILDIPEELLVASLNEPELQVWWENFNLTAPLTGLPKKRYPEKAVTAELEGFRFIAKYDLLAVDPGKKIVIMDWKTSRKRQPSAFIRKAIQSRLYPFLFVLAGDFLNEKNPVNPEQVEMTYWFMNFPDSSETIHYSEEKFHIDLDFFKSLALEISKIPEGMFILTDDERKCIYCNYRSLCNRGKAAGNWVDREDEEPETTGDESLSLIDFDQIGEIAF